MTDCPHEFHESEAAVATEGLCPLCLAADVNRLMIENERLRAALVEIRGMSDVGNTIASLREISKIACDALMSRE